MPLQRRVVATDKAGDSHFNLISALHKSLRGGDPDAGLYWLARMCEAGEDPLYIARRAGALRVRGRGQRRSAGAVAGGGGARRGSTSSAIRSASSRSRSAWSYLALAPKSVAIYYGYEKAARRSTTPPLRSSAAHRNAPTPLMKDLGYGKDYVYPPSDPDAAPQEFLPDELKGWTFYAPSGEGFEADLAKRLESSEKPEEVSRAGSVC